MESTLKPSEKDIKDIAGSKIALPISNLEAPTQKETKPSILKACDELLKKILIENDKKLVCKPSSNYQTALATLYNTLICIRDEEKTKTDPKMFLQTLEVINKALPTETNYPTKLELDALVDLGTSLQTQPSIWKKIGVAMIVLALAIAISVGIVLSVSSIGIATPLGIALATIGVFSGVSALVGVGFFAYNRNTNNLSQDILNLSATLNL